MGLLPLPFLPPCTGGPRGASGGAQRPRKSAFSCDFSYPTERLLIIFLHNSKKSCNFGRRLPCGHSPESTVASCRAYASMRKNFSYGITPCVYECYYPFLCKHKRKISLLNTQIYLLKKNSSSKTCICAIFVVPLRQNWKTRWIYRL